MVFPCELIFSVLSYTLRLNEWPAKDHARKTLQKLADLLPSDSQTKVIFSWYLSPTED
jgi:hypothetical protein